MKKLNKKGFTLIELLAVIVILAVVMVLVIPNVFSNLGSGVDSGFDVAVGAVQKYLNDQKDICMLGVPSAVNFDTTIFADTKTCKFFGDEATIAKIIENAGYKGQISSITLEDSGDFHCVEGTPGGAPESCPLSEGITGVKVRHYNSKITNAKASSTSKFGEQDKNY